MDSASVSTSDTDSTVMIPNKFHLLKSFSFPKHIYFDRRMRSVRLDQNGVTNTAGYTTMLPKTLHFATYV